MLPLLPMPMLCLPIFFFSFFFSFFLLMCSHLDWQCCLPPPPSTSTQPKWASPQVCQFFFSAMLCTHDSHPHSLGLQRQRGSTLTPHCQHMNMVPLAMEVALDRELSSPLMCSCKPLNCASMMTMTLWVYIHHHGMFPFHFTCLSTDYMCICLWYVFFWVCYADQNCYSGCHHVMIITAVAAAP